MVIVHINKVKRMQVIDWTRFGKKFNETRVFAICYNCANRKHGNWVCQSNMVYELDYEGNKCKSFVKRKDGGGN